MHVQRTTTHFTHKEINLNIDLRGKRIIFLVQNFVWEFIVEFHFDNCMFDSHSMRIFES